LLAEQRKKMGEEIKRIELLMVEYVDSIDESTEIIELDNYKDGLKFGLELLVLLEERLK
jgi:hypothetical protein